MFPHSPELRGFGVESNWLDLGSRALRKDLSVSQQHIHGQSNWERSLRWRIKTQLSRYCPILHLFWQAITVFTRFTQIKQTSQYKKMTLPTDADLSRLIRRNRMMLAGSVAVAIAAIVLVRNAIKKWKFDSRKHWLENGPIVVCVG